MNEIINGAYQNMLCGNVCAGVSKLYNAATSKYLAAMKDYIPGDDDHASIQLEEFAQELFALGYSECMRQITNGAVDLLRNSK